MYYLDSKMSISRMNQCIICRKETTQFSDEHVIPDSLKGYYHIHTVCKACNNHLGAKVDSKLVNHTFMDFTRNALGIKGKSGIVPNPFSGVHTLSDDPDQKITVSYDKNGVMVPKLLPKIPDFQTDDVISKFSITIDATDYHKKDKIIQKILKRNGIENAKIKIEEEKRSLGMPKISAQVQIDVKDFRIGLLKIAYEFAVDTIDGYFQDPMAIKISKILHDADTQRMENDVIFYGNGFEKGILRPLAHLIEFENDNHYLVLMQDKELGLLCQVNLFNSFSIAIKLSESSSFGQEPIIIGVNDIKERTFEKLTVDDLVKRTYTAPTYSFQYWFAHPSAAKDFYELERDISFGYFREGDNVPFFDKDGNVRYTDIRLKLHQEHLLNIPIGDDIHEISADIVLDEELYIKLLPTLSSYRVVAVRVQHFRTNRI
jgi:hypothetical protein